MFVEKKFIVKSKLHESTKKKKKGKSVKKEISEGKINTFIFLILK